MVRLCFKQEVNSGLLCESPDCDPPLWPNLHSHSPSVEVRLGGVGARGGHGLLKPGNPALRSHSTPDQTVPHMT